MNLLDVAYGCAGVLAAPWWMRKARDGWRERCGFAPPLLPPERPRVLLHAVSVGEVHALRSLVPLLTPRFEVLVSSTTDTGLKRARELFDGTAAAVVRYPLDFSACVGRFLDAVRVDAAVLVELEVWPNFLAACRRRGVPALVVNGRLSERSFGGYKKIRPAMRSSFASLRLAAVQDGDYAKRFVHMGVDPARCLVTGSMKWDAAGVEDRVAGADELASRLGLDRSKPLIVAGSTGPGEEELLAAACPKDAQLLCAPRKPERFHEAAAALRGCVRWSNPQKPTGRFFLLDTIGQLRRAYSLADAVVIGRSFGDLHGSDPIEPAALGKAVVIGPAFGDFARPVAALAAAGGIVCTNREGLAGDLAALIADPARRRGLAHAARRCVLAHQGASRRNAELIAGALTRAS